MYLSIQHFFQTPHKTLKSQEKCIFQQSAGLGLKIFPSVFTMGPPSGTFEISKQ